MAGRERQTGTEEKNGERWTILIKTEEERREDAEVEQRPVARLEEVEDEVEDKIEVVTRQLDDREERMEAMGNGWLEQWENKTTRRGRTAQDPLSRIWKREMKRRRLEEARKTMPLYPQKGIGHGMGGMGDKLLEGKFVSNINSNSSLNPVD